jgi:ABC-type Na+ efflux pump permease subunit
MTSRRRIALIALGLVALVVIMAGGVIGVRFLAEASSTPTSFVVYFTQPPSPAEIRALGKRVAATSGVASVDYLDEQQALESVKRERAARPDDFIPEGSSPGPVRCALHITTVRPWNAMATRRVVVMLERDPAFQGVFSRPAPPGGWVIPPR